MFRVLSSHLRYLIYKIYARIYKVYFSNIYNTVILIVNINRYIG